MSTPMTKLQAEHRALTRVGFAIVSTVLLLCVAILLSGCAVGWQINMPASYGQCHSRGSSYNAAGSKQMDIAGTAESFQQQRATTGTGDALGTSVEADKATDVAAAKGQSQVGTETAKGARQGQGSASGNVTPTNTPTDTTSIAPSLAVAPGGVAGNKVAAPNASPGNATADASNTTPPAPAAKGDGKLTCVSCGDPLTESSPPGGQCQPCRVAGAAKP